uniref:Uncharacterized protein n=1 Tax=Pararge aegeria TaxID=116150 RepID=S4PE95_9NEOP
MRVPKGYYKRIVNSLIRQFFLLIRPGFPCFTIYLVHFWLFCMFNWDLRVLTGLALFFDIISSVVVASHCE